jgi:hypothetical protein
MLTKFNIAVNQSIILKQKKIASNHSMVLTQVLVIWGSSKMFSVLLDIIRNIFQTKNVIEK